MAKFMHSPMKIFYDTVIALLVFHHCVLFIVTWVFFRLDSVTFDYKMK
jgi:hypothetical protein